MTLKSINPYGTSLIKAYKEYTDDQVSEVINFTAEAFKKWKYVSFGDKSKFMRQVAEILRKNRDIYAKTITLEMGKAISEAKAEIEKCAWVCDYYAENAENQLRTEIVQTDAALSRVQYEAIGIVLGIMPWNFPFWQVFRFLAPALMAGNTALLKHASNVQGCAEHIQHIIREAGFPKHVFNILIIGSDKIAKVIENEKVNAVTLTGSEFAGSAVASHAGKYIKKSVLELGGSNAFVVLEDANVDQAVQEAVTARFMNCGQSCIASKRFLIHTTIADSFTAKFKAEVKKLKVGNPLSETTRLGPLVNTDQAKEIERQVNASIQLGAIPLMPVHRKEAFFYPVILTHVTPGMPVFDEEVFGPVAPIITFKTDDEAVELANNSKFGLGVTLFTTNMKRAEKLIPQFEEGSVFINSLVKSDPRLPFGGIKKSGYGRELSYHGIREFVNAKTVYFAGLDIKY